MRNLQIERAIISALLKSPQGLTRLQLQRRALNGYMRYDYDPVIEFLIFERMIERTSNGYRLRDNYIVSLRCPK